MIHPNVGIQMLSCTKRQRLKATVFVRITGRKWCRILVLKSATVLRII